MKRKIQIESDRNVLEFLEDGLIVAECSAEAFQWVNMHKVLGSMIAAWRSGQMSDEMIEQRCDEVQRFVDGQA